MFARLLFNAMAFSVAQPAMAQAGNGASAEAVSMTPAQLFAFADKARDGGDYQVAEAAYRALAENRNVELRTEARFRLALMLSDRMEKPREAAVLLRQILDEQPEAARVRLELARILAAMGEYGRAGQELRAAQAAGLPPEVDRLVRFYAGALRTRKPFGGSLAVAIAPDSNINRATTSDTLGTVIGDFDLSDDAQAKSGVGLDMKAQGYLRQPLSATTTMLVQASGAGRLYREREFDDYSLALQAGPEIQSGADRIALSGLVSWRWYGRTPYSFGYGATANIQHPVGKRGRATVDASVLRTDDKLSDPRDAIRYGLAAGADRAFSAKSGGGIRLLATRSVARDPGYSTASGGFDAYAFREWGSTTFVLKVGYDHLEADERLILYPSRRVDDRFSANLAGTFRSLRVASFAPLARIGVERNKSSVEIYDYKRISAEIGVTAAF